jgi:hypothetical protein
VTRSQWRFLIAISLAAVIETTRLDFNTWALPAGTGAVAQAQAIPDPGFGDPYAKGGYGNVPPPPSTTQIISPNLPNNYGPGAPAMPGAPTRPQSWPGGNADGSTPTAGGYPPPGGGAPPQGYRVATAGRPTGVSQPPASPRKSPADPPYDPVEIVAHVGSEVIQASEILPMVNQQIAIITKEHAAELAQLSPQERDAQLNPIRRELMKRAVDDIVKVKLLLTELRRKVPAEALTKHEKMMREYFNSKEIKRLMDENKATSVPDLEIKLQALGSSLESQRIVFVERQLAGSWLNEHTKNEKQGATHEEMLTYYKVHAANWDSPSRVRWEQLTAKFTNFNSKQEAYQSLARWGNDVLRGVPFATVAKAHSQDVSAEDGGVHDWASKDSLRSVVLDQALFSLPVGALSQIIEDEDGLHIVRVVEREVAKRTPFTEVQSEIKKSLKDGGKENRQGDYLAKLREQTPVTTIFDEDFVARMTPPAAATIVR